MPRHLIDSDLTSFPYSLTISSPHTLTLSAMSSGRVVFTSTGGLLASSSSLAFDGRQLSLSQTGTSGGLVLGGDTNLYRSAADVLKTDDSLVVAASLTVGSLTSGRVPFAGTSGLLSDSSNLTYTSGTGQLTLATTGSGAGILIGGDAQLYRSAADVLCTPDSLQVDTLFGAGGAPAARMHGQGNLTAGAWTTNGIGLRLDAATFTDSSSSGTVAAQAAHAIGQPTLAASSSTTYTGAATLYLANAPAAGTNVTIAGAYALWVAAGTARFDGTVRVNGLTNTRVVVVGASGTLGDSANMTFNTLTGRLTLAGNTSSGGILIGGDAQLYRSAADMLRTPDSLTVDANLIVSGGLGFFGTTPTTQNTGWSVTSGYTPDKAFDPETAGVLETARVLGTLVDALKGFGLLGS